MSESNGVETRVMALVGNPAVVQAMDALKRASEAKDSFADSFANLVASVEGIREIVDTYEQAMAFVKFCLDYRGVTGKGKTRREQNRVAYVKAQATIALCETLGIEVPKGKASKWEYQRWLDSVRNTIESHELNLDTVIHDLRDE